MESLRERSTEAVLCSPWPSNKAESYRFTDVRFLKSFNVEPIALPSLDAESLDRTGLDLTEEESMSLVFVDGTIVSDPPPSHAWQEGQGVFFGSISALPDGIVRKDVVPKLGTSAEWIHADFFASLNGVGASELGVIIVPDGVKARGPLHVLYYSSQAGKKDDGKDDDKGTYCVSSPRLLILMGKGSELHLVEEFIGGGETGELYWANAVAEIFLEDGAQVFHSYVQNQGRDAVHIKQTCVAQVGPLPV
jgi:Fe-S cluster assembly protein SufD